MVESLKWVISNLCQLKKVKAIDILGIVTNGDGWKFYKLAVDGKGYETPLYSTGDMDRLLGRLRYIFQLCEQNLLTDY